MKRFISKALLVSTILSTPVLTFAQTDIQNGNINKVEGVSFEAKESNEDLSSLFDEYGVRKGAVKLGSTSETIQQLEKAENMSLNKAWTISFTGAPTSDNVYSMTIQKGNEYIPVKIELDKGNKATVTPVNNYEPSSNYVVKIVLNNGKRYEKPFTTTTKDNLAYTDETHFTFKGGVITDYSNDGPKDLVMIPRKIRGEEVTTIANKAFRSKGISKVIIPDTVTDIQGGQYNTLDGAFANNRLTDVVIPDSVTKIGMHAFYNNRISKIEFSKNLSSLESNAFANNVLSKVTIPESLTNINSGVFASNKITELVIPNKVTNIGASAFRYNNLTQLTISSGVTNIESYAFGNNDLTQVNIPETVDNIESFAFTENKLTKLVIPTSITSIAEGAFSSNMLVDVAIPKSVTTIENKAFRSNKITNIEIPDSVTTIGGGQYYTLDGAFAYNRIKKLVIPSSITSIGKNVFYFNPIEELVIPDSVRVIDEGAFGANPHLKETSVKDGTVFFTTSFHSETIVNKRP